MIKAASLSVAFLALAALSVAQNRVGINNSDPKAALDINGGLRLRPITSLVSGTAVTLLGNHGYHFINGTPTGNFTISFSPTPVEGQHTVITNTTIFTGIVLAIAIPPATTVVLFYSNGDWKQIGSSQPIDNTAWSLAGNNINSNLQFIGTSNNADVVFKRNGQNSGVLGSINTSFGVGALNNRFVAFYNTAIGDSALADNLSGSDNTAIGSKALANNVYGQSNTATGSGALTKNTQGYYNTATGNRALYYNFSGSYNVAIGLSSLGANTTGWNNTSLGSAAMIQNTTGYSNVGIGVRALFSNITRSNLVAIGDSALYNNGNESVSPDGVMATKNTAVGSKSLYGNSSGFSNTALGSESGKNNTQGFSNTAVGAVALRDNVEGDLNTGVGASALVTINGNNNTALGAFAGHSIANGNENTIVGVNKTDVFFSRNISGSTFLGFNAGRAETSSNKLYIDNSDDDKNNALIYGDFAADSLLLNAKTINKFSLNVRGSNALEMGYGTAGKQTDAGKIQYGGFGDPAHWLAIVGGGTAALGGDRVIKLWSEGGLRIKGNALPNTDNGHSLGQSGLRWSSVWAVNGTINTSDANLKTNITHSPYGLNEVMQMNPVQYNWKTNPTEDSQIGFLAQDIQKIIPEAVVVPANGDPLGMKYTELIPVLVKAIQELQKQNFDMQKQIDTLKEQKH